jgi:predicted transglutaminase-like cysteine proteinase
MLAALAALAAGPAFGQARPEPAAAPMLALADDQPAPRHRLGLFGSLEFRAGSLAAIPEWTAVLDRVAAERAGLAACDERPAGCASPAVAAWRAELRTLRGRPALEQLAAVNAFVNHAVAWQADLDNYGVSDHWASPVEFLGGTGDCEDFAITKFVSLLDLGWPNEDIRLVVVNDALRDIPHAVVAVRLEGQTWILDSLMDIVLTHDKISQYTPHYSVNLTDRWAHLVTPEVASSLQTN